VSRVPRPLARKLDRLARRAHRFHRFAHHPLCAEYAGELVRLGRRGRVCRGCATALAGCALGVTCGALIPIAADAGSAARACWVALMLSFACAAALSLSLGVRSPRAPHLGRARAPKSITRLLPAAVFACACLLGARSGGVAGIALLASDLGACAFLYTRYRTRGPSRTPCQTCPERTLSIPCRGYAPIVQRERAFARIARRMLA
jgi:hypothetical protein